LICNLEAVALEECLTAPFAYGELWGGNHDSAAHVILTVIQNEAIRMSSNAGQHSLTQSYGTGGVSSLAIRGEHRECNGQRSSHGFPPESSTFADRDKVRGGTRMVNIDVAPDGRFFLLKEPEQPPPTDIKLIVNFFDVLRERVGN